MTARTAHPHPTAPASRPVVPCGPDDIQHSQALATGAVGITLLHIERAEIGVGSWASVREWLVSIAASPLIASDDASLFVGAPALAFVLNTAAGTTGHHRDTLRTLDAAVTKLTTRRLDQAHARIDRGEHTTASEYDLLYGLTGLGAYLLQRDPRSDTLHDVLAYLVRLTQPLPGSDLPGWWVRHDPSGRTSGAFPGGHGNLGLAHGITGPLALLALAKSAGALVDGHADAMLRILAWLDGLRQDVPAGPWWPQWVTADEHRLTTVFQEGPRRPSWCYGTPGLARAQQLAATALGDDRRKKAAEHALLRCITDPAQLAQIGEPGLCHGAAGLLHTVHRVAQDAARPDQFTAHLPALRALLHAQVPARQPGFLDGTAGTALALHATDRGGAPTTSWDACLLLS
ncbi:lanthionine synthetase C family protein [Streptomyces sp. CB01881]|uniref:lanthionine synthetase C family protein n=1 Tax=Streptomyces sp. CB01881 TaxID=2078691 RepID=UPI000CDC9343|nr:lanthionine synthetase C family protein [Streptomyces sp. CB01881]AUY50464.1 lanthionine synthetase [Streptomyces sp. CB01881]TYC73851.1 lanthionine synthetase [Streptomyces sp. CB01881]